MSDTDHIAQALEDMRGLPNLTNAGLEMLSEAAEIVRAFGVLEKRKLSVVQLPGCRVRIEKMRLTADGENYEAEFVLWADDLLTAIREVSSSVER